MAVDVGTAMGYLDLDISGFLKRLKEAQGQAQSSAKSITGAFGDSLSSAGAALTKVGKSLTTKVTAPIAGLAISTAKTGIEFNSAMSKVQAISGATGDQFLELRDKAISLGEETVFSATEVANGMTEMAKAGWTSQQIMDGMVGVLNASSASGENLASVSTIVADAITGFGMEAADATKVADMLTQAANAGTIDIADLGESFKYIAPLAQSCNYSMSDVTTALSAMSMAGIKGSQAGTSLRTVLSSMMDPTDDVAAAMQELGIDIADEEGKMYSLNDVVGQMRDGFSGLTEEQRAYYASVLAGRTGSAGLLALLNLTEEEYDELSSSMENCNGVAEETSKVMLDNLQGDLTLLGSAAGTAKLKIFDLANNGLRTVVQKITELVNKFNALSPEQQEQIVKWVGIAAAIGPVLLAIGKVVSAIGGMLTTFSKLKTGLSAATKAFKLFKAGSAAASASTSTLGTAVGALTGPLGAIIAVVAVLVAAFVNLWKNNENFRTQIKLIWDQIKQTFTSSVERIKAVLERLKPAFDAVVKVLKAIWNGFCELLAPVFTGAFQLVANAFNTITNVICDLLEFFVDFFTGNWEGAWNDIVNIFKDVWNGIVGVFTSVWQTLIGLLDTVCGWFGTTWANVWNGIKDFFVNIWTSISDWFRGIIEGIVTFFKNAWSGISSFFKDLWSGIASFFSEAWETIKNIVQVGIMFIVELISAAFQLITLPFRFIWENCKEYIYAAWDWMKEQVSNILEKISATITKAWDAVSAVFETVWTAISDFVSEIWDGIKSVIKSVLSVIKTIITTIFNAIVKVVTTCWNNLKNNITTVINLIKTVITAVFNAVKTVVTNIWNNIKTTITNVLNAVKGTVTSVIDNIKSKFTSGFNAVKSTVTNIFNSIKSTITNVMNSAKSVVTNAIDRIKSAFNFSWSLPKLKLPHLSISGRFSINPPSVPHFSISWYKKAMGNGMILNSPTIFGYDAQSGSFLAGGEAGSETVVGTESLLSMIKAATADAVKGLIATVIQTFDTLKVSLDNLSDTFVNELAMLLVAVRDYAQVMGEYNLKGGGGISEDWYALAKMLAQVLRDNPYNPIVNVYLEDGDVIMDNERVGRKVAPVVSRIIVQSR